MTDASTDSLPETFKPLLAKLIERQDEGKQAGEVPQLGATHPQEGWKTLEQAYLALVDFFRGDAETPLRPDAGQPIQNLSYPLAGCVAALVPHVPAAFVHENRYIREAGFVLYDVMIPAAPQAQLGTYSAAVAESCSQGLADNWSQVRFVASVATRTLFQHADADNHAVREAACCCINELATQVDHQAVIPYVGVLTNSLLACFRDGSWPVRDMACLACGYFVTGMPSSKWGSASFLCVIRFPEECRSLGETLYGLMWNNLHDSIGSVRENAAVALGSLAKVYTQGTDKANLWPDLPTKILEDLASANLSIRKQPADTGEVKSHPNLSNTTVFAVAQSRGVTLDQQKVAKDNDPDSHTDRVMYSCGSLAPRKAGHRLEGAASLLTKGTHPGKGEADTEAYAGHDVSAAGPADEPWFYSDGAVYLIRELAQFDWARESVCGYLKQLPDNLRRKDFAHYYRYWQTVWTEVPAIARFVKLTRRALGKRVFSREALDSLLPYLMDALDCSHQLASEAARDCARELAELYGPRIFSDKADVVPGMLVRLRNEGILPQK
eukprot:gene11527-315_t